MRSPRHSAPPSASPSAAVPVRSPGKKGFRAFSALIWHGLPTLIVAVASVYVGLVIAWGVYPPMIPVEGSSMRPTLVTGDLVFVHSVDTRDLRVGQIIAVKVPQPDIDKYNLPSRVVHRIAAIERTPSGLEFTTKGDGNPGVDVFTTSAADVVGEVTGHLSYLGMPFLFFRAIQGQIFLGGAAAVALIYMLMGWAEARKEKNAVALDALFLETRQLREAVEQATLSPPPAPHAPIRRASSRASKVTDVSFSASRSRASRSRTWVRLRGRNRPN